MLQLLEVEGGHNGQGSPLVEDAIGHLPPIENTVAIGKHKVPNSLTVFVGRLQDQQIFYASHVILLL